jgi:hypothetical protein
MTFSGSVAGPAAKLKTRSEVVEVFGEGWKGEVVVTAQVMEIGFWVVDLGRERVVGKAENWVAGTDVDFRWMQLEAAAAMAMVAEIFPI